MIRKFSAMLALIAAATLLLTTACNEEVVPATGITLNRPAASLLVGDALTLEASVEPAEATNKTVRWTTDNARVATVNSAGEITAVAPGTAKITAAAEKGKFSVTCIVIVIETGVITMTTLASEVALSMVIVLGTDVLIDWGDGSKSNINDTPYKQDPPYYDGKMSLGFFHNYSSTAEHNITITGKVLLLYCANNQLTSLDVSRNAVLRELRCGGNQLTELDVSRNTELEILSCGINQLTSLDVSSNTELWDLECTHNQLTELKVRGANKLAILKCNENQLSSLDMSGNTASSTLVISNNRLTASALNDLFRTLRPRNSLYAKAGGPWISVPGAVIVWDNPGASDCDVTIAEEKGWIVVIENRRP